MFRTHPGGVDCIQQPGVARGRLDGLAGLAPLTLRRSWRKVWRSRSTSSARRTLHATAALASALRKLGLYTKMKPKESWIAYGCVIFSRSIQVYSTKLLSVLTAWCFRRALRSTLTWASSTTPAPASTAWTSMCIWAAPAAEWRIASWRWERWAPHTSWGRTDSI